ISGTNAHVILEEAPVDPCAETAAAEPAAPALAIPIVLSAKSEAALRGQAERLRAHLAAHPALALVDVAYSLATTRSHFEHRAALVARDLGELDAALAAFAQGSGKTVRSGEGKLAVLFTGQGSQRPGMGRGLYDAFPVYREALDAACALLDA